MTLNFMWVHSRIHQAEVGSSFDYSGEEHLQPPLWAVHREYFVFVLEYNSCLSSIYIIHPQDKFRASAPTQLQPRRWLLLQGEEDILHSRCHCFAIRLFVWSDDFLGNIQQYVFQRCTTFCLSNPKFGMEIQQESSCKTEASLERNTFFNILYRG